MSDLSFVRERIAAGDQALFFHDHYGQQWIELRRGRIFKRKTRVRLLPEEIMQAKAALEGRQPRLVAWLVVPHTQARYEHTRVSLGGPSNGQAAEACAPKDGRAASLRKISDELAGYLNERGRPYNPNSRRSSRIARWWN